MDSLKINSIISKKIQPLEDTNTIESAFKIMLENSISSVVIVNKGHIPIGIFTEHDALKVIVDNIDTKATLSTVMSTNIHTANKDRYIHDAYMLMEQNNFTHVVVTEKNATYLGVVTEGDFIRHISYKEILRHQNVEEALCDSFLSIKEGTTIGEAASLMQKQDKDYAVITKDMIPTGIVTQRDIVLNFAKKTFHKDTKVEIFQKNNIRFVERSISLEEASTLMQSHDIHQLVVIDYKKRLLGVVSRHNILKAIHGSYFEFLLKTIKIKNINEQELEKKTIFLNSIVNTIPYLVWLKDLDGKYLLCNSMFERYFGKNEDSILGKTDFDFFDYEIAKDIRNRDLSAIQYDGLSLTEKPMVFIDGTRTGLYDIIKTPIRDTNDNIVGILGIAHDVSDRLSREKALEKLANYDLLTGLPNRSFLKAYLDKSLAKAYRNKSSLALILLDLDRFKDINDSYGHTIGDELLKLVADKLLSRLREGDLIARLGGDEFAIILENINHEDDIGKIIKEILSGLSSTTKLTNGVEIQIASSAGIVIAPKDGFSVEELMQHADSALYQAKSDGTAMYRYYTDEMTKSARNKIVYESRIRRALDNNEFEVYYQPQVHLQTGRIVGTEALIRWNEPIEGIISPQMFIPIAEETGLINDIGKWVLHEACKQGKIWFDAGYRISIAVNVSANQVKYQNLSKLVDEALSESGLNPERLELEITESSIMQREEDAVAMLHALRAKGIRLAIDDFGTGYSSLSYLKRFPIDVLKIDKSFIDDIPYGHDDMAIVIAIIEMGKALGYHVLAEGAEHVEQVDFLKEKGCTMYQGYFKSKPVPASEFTKLLEAQES